VCAKLNGQIKTLTEWKAEGLPGHRNEGCYYNCCCDLVRIKTARTRDIREKNEYGIPKNYEHDYAGRVNKEFEHIKTGKYDKDENGNDVKDKWGNSMKGVTIEGIDTLNDKLGYTNEVMKDIGVNYQEQAYIALKYIQATVGKKALKELKEVNVVPLEQACGEFNFNKQKEPIINMSEQYFAKAETGKNGLQRGDWFDKIKPNEFSNTFVHELTHYLIFRCGLKYDKKMIDFYKENRTYMLDRFSSLGNSIYKGREHEEVLAQLIAGHYDGTLYNRDYKNAGKYKKEHGESIQFVKEILEKFKRRVGNYV
jgi:hypothetical protein